MRHLIRRTWRYLVAMLTGRLNQLADPTVQLAQAMHEAQEQHRLLREQAANVIANQKQIELRLGRALDVLERVNSSTRQAVLMVADAERVGDADKAAQFNVAAESFANRLIAVEHEVGDLKGLHLQATEAANRAKAAVTQNAVVLQRKLTERAKLLEAYDQARMAERMNHAMGALSETVGAEVPTLDEVRVKIEERYARAQAVAELGAQSVERQMLEVEQQIMATQAQRRLAQIRENLGILPETNQPEALNPPGNGTAT